MVDSTGFNARKRDIPEITTRDFLETFARKLTSLVSVFFSESTIIISNSHKIDRRITFFPFFRSYERKNTETKLVNPRPNSSKSRIISIFGISDETLDIVSENRKS